MHTNDQNDIPLHGPMLSPRSPKATLICFGVAGLITALVCLAGM